MSSVWIIALLVFVPIVWVFSFAIFRSAGRADRELDRMRSQNYSMFVSSQESDAPASECSEEIFTVRYKQASVS